MVNIGDRAQVLLYEERYCNGENVFHKEPIYLYTHWGGYRIKETLANALKRGEGRWDDPSYLNRIIISEFVKDDTEGLTGIGVSRNYQDSSDATDVKLYASYDPERQEIVIPEGNESFTYSEFVDKFADTE